SRRPDPSCATPRRDEQYQPAGLAMAGSGPAGFTGRTGPSPRRTGVLERNERKADDPPTSRSFISLRTRRGAASRFRDHRGDEGRHDVSAGVPRRAPAGVQSARDALLHPQLRARTRLVPRAIRRGGRGGSDRRQDPRLHAYENRHGADGGGTSRSQAYGDPARSDRPRLLALLAY